MGELFESLQPNCQSKLSNILWLHLYFLEVTLDYPRLMDMLEYKIPKYKKRV